jgi:hypothetical protein
MESGALQLSLVALGDRDPLEWRQPFFFSISLSDLSKIAADVLELPLCLPCSPGQKWSLAPSSCRWSRGATVTLWSGASPSLSLGWFLSCPKAVARFNLVLYS